MNVIYTTPDFFKKAMRIPMSPDEKSLLLKNYALKKFRLVSQNGTSSDFWLDNLELGDYGTHEVICCRQTKWEEEGYDIMVCSDTELAEKLFLKGLGFHKKGDTLYTNNLGNDGITVMAFWFMVNREVLKRHKTVIKIGKRRNAVQDMGEKRANAHHQKPIKISDGISYTWEYENPRSFNRHCEAWGVRGHYRHYKNGKVVFIHPYIKGSGRLKDSLYEI